MEVDRVRGLVLCAGRRERPTRAAATKSNSLYDGHSHQKPPLRGIGQKKGR
jgi:hypothetical protein